MTTISLLLLLVGFASSPELPDASYRCFVSTGTRKPIRLEMAVFSYSRWTGGYVQYKGSKKPISIVPLSVESTELAPDRPYEFETTWLEIVDGRPAGKYVVTTQGARTYGFTYTAADNSKHTDFSEDLDAQPDGNAGCAWH